MIIVISEHGHDCMIGCLRQRFLCSSSKSERFLKLN